MIPMYKISGRLGNQMFQIAYIYAQMMRKEVSDIYVQDPALFSEYEQDIKQMYGADIKPIDQVAIHVRRGDYVGNEFYVDLSTTNYYERAMAEFPDADFLVFSDDIEWSKQQKIFSKCEFSTGNEIDDMNMMAGCRGIIMANSSFSWWGAYISPYALKVVCPSIFTLWYSDGKVRTKVPKEWLQIEK